MTEPLLPGALLTELLLTEPPLTEPLHVIVDGGLDDALALSVLVGLNVAMSQVVATEGSVSLLTTATATGRLMATLGSSVPVRLGSDRALAGAYPAGRDPFHGTDAFGGKAEALKSAPIPSEQAHSLAGSVLCCGALTLVAQAIQVGCSLTDVVWMGGAVAVGGNMTAAAEFNAWMDPEATDQVLASGVPVRMVPLDVTERFAWSAIELDSLRAAGRLGHLLADAIALAHDRDGFFVPHDAVTAVALTSPDLFRWTARQARCETRGELTSGETVVDRRPWIGPGTVLVAEDVDVPEVSARILAAVASLR
jgi:pyrimidine-specific ribonucleoside hydrolase